MKSLRPRMFLGRKLPKSSCQIVPKLIIGPSRIYLRCMRPCCTIKTYILKDLLEFTAQEQVLAVNSPKMSQIMMFNPSLLVQDTYH